MKKLIIVLMTLYAVVVLVLAGAIVANAATVTLAWDPSDSPDVAGYKIYYKADSAELPLNGTEAAEGASPIDVGNVTTTEINLPTGNVWNFRATAYDESGYESSLSNLATRDMVPPVPPTNLRVTVTVDLSVAVE